MGYKLSSCIVFSSVVFIQSISAQDSQTKVTSPVFTSGSFYYDFPQSFGFTAGLTYPLSSRLIFVNKKNRQKQKIRNFIASTDFGFYRYVFNNTGLMLMQSFGFRYHKSGSFYFQWQITAGTLRTFYDGTVYSVNNNGIVHKLNGFGRWYAVTGLSTVFGHDWQQSSKPLPVAVFIHPLLWMQWPYNNFVLPHVSVQLGVRYHFPSFNLSLHQKEIKRGRTS